MPHDVIMPALGMSQETAQLISWLKHPGDSIRAGDALMEVETDKAVMEVEAQADGFLTNVSAAAGDHVPVGHVVAVITETADADDTLAANNTALVDSPTAGADTPEESLPTGKEIIKPAPGITQDTGLISARRNNTGDPVSADDILLEVETDKSVMQVEAGQPSVPSARILASPKARRLALERGLDLERLVELGVPQPYHVADLDRLQDVGPGTALLAMTAEASAVNNPALMQISARVPAGGCDEFIDWLAKIENIDLPACSVWLRFATAALRQTTASGTDRLIVEIKQVRGANGRFADADRSRLSQSISEHSDLPPDLILRDFTGSPITTASVSLGSAAVLTIGREHNDYVISFDYRADQLEENQAIHFTTDFAERLGEPLLHLL